jgi:hypothetical protein
MSFTSNLENTLFHTVFMCFERTVCDTNFLNHKNTSRHQHKLKCPPLHTVFLSLESTVCDGSFSSLDTSVFVPQFTSEVRHA